MARDEFKDTIEHMKWKIDRNYEITKKDIERLEEYFDKAFEEERYVGD